MGHPIWVVRRGNAPVGSVALLSEEASRRAEGEGDRGSSRDEGMKPRPPRRRSRQRGDHSPYRGKRLQLPASTTIAPMLEVTFTT